MIPLDQLPTARAAELERRLRRIERRLDVVGVGVFLALCGVLGTVAGAFVAGAP